MDYRWQRSVEMTARKQTVSFTEPAFAYAQTLVDSGEYPSISAAVSGEMVRAKAAREAQAALLAAEVERRLALPIDRWEPVGEFSEVTGEARVRLAELRRTQAGRHR
jgi:antitoxin ParD1/3/4